MIGLFKTFLRCLTFYYFTILLKRASLADARRLDISKVSLFAAGNLASASQSSINSWKILVA